MRVAFLANSRSLTFHMALLDPSCLTTTNPLKAKIFKLWSLKCFRFKMCSIRSWNSRTALTNPTLKLLNLFSLTVLRKPTAKPNGSLQSIDNQPIFNTSPPKRGQPLGIRVIFYAFDSSGLLVQHSVSKESQHLFNANVHSVWIQRRHVIEG